METLAPEETNDPEKYAELQEKIDQAHDQFIRRHLKRVWPKNLLRLIGILQILLALAFLGVDLPIILMFAPRWQICAGSWAFLFALIAGVMTIRSTIRSTWLKLNWTLVINIVGAVATTVMMVFDIIYIINPNICISLSGCNYLSYTFDAAKPYYMAQTGLGVGFLVTVVGLVLCYVKFGLGGSKLFDEIQQGNADPLRQPILEPYPPPVQNNPMYRPRMMMYPRVGMPAPVRPVMAPAAAAAPVPPGMMMMMPGVPNPRIMLRPRAPFTVTPMYPPASAVAPQMMAPVGV